jgi:hypothetical protein
MKLKHRGGWYDENASEFYLGDVWFESRQGKRLSWLNCIVIFSQNL